MNKKTKKKKNKQFPLPVYKSEDDIYNRAREVPLGEEDHVVEREFNPAQGLDIPGTELDDANEKIGEEDEENNYYSLGGDDHDDLEESKE